jgi:CTP synthase
MQCSVIEFARHVCGLSKAHSSEFDLGGPDPVIDLMQNQKAVAQKGGTMRLGAWPCVIEPGSRVSEAYGVGEVSERHRHRYEVNNRYREVLSQQGMRFSGLSPDSQYVEMIELADHPWFIGTQFHPEFRSRPRDPHPLFRSFIQASLKYHLEGSR